MSEQQKQHHPTTTRNLHHSTAAATPNSRRAVKFLTATAIGTVLLGLSCLTLTGTVIALIVATPVLVIFSPVLVPAAIAAFLIASGFVVSGGCGVAALSVLYWIYQYATGKHPPGADQLDRARMKITGAAREVTEKAKGNMQYVQHKSQEGTTGTTHQQQITSS